MAGVEHSGKLHPDTPGGSELYSAFLGALPISGAAVTVVGSGGISLTVCSSDQVAARIEELQFELGEGPRWLAVRTGTLVNIPDIESSHQTQWPILGAALAALPIGALFSVPMKMGAVTLGAVTLYRDKPGKLSVDHQNTALAIASAISGAAVQQAVRSATEDSELASAETSAMHREVHQATGMILVQLDTTATIAYSRLQAYAFAQERTVQSVALDVVSRKLIFEDLP